jgi:hypothetical protein
MCMCKDLSVDSKRIQYGADRIFPLVYVHVVESCDVCKDLSGMTCIYDYIFESFCFV